VAKVSGLQIIGMWNIFNKIGGGPAFILLAGHT